MGEVAELGQVELKVQYMPMKDSVTPETDVLLVILLLGRRKAAVPATESYALAMTPSPNLPLIPIPFFPLHWCVPQKSS